VVESLGLSRHRKNSFTITYHNIVNREAADVAERLSPSLDGIDTHTVLQISRCARMAELVDARDLKSCSLWECQFDSDYAHQNLDVDKH